MAEWASANLAALLPEEVTDALDTVKGLIATVQTALKFVQAFLDKVKLMLINFPLFDFLDQLATTIKNIKNDLLMTGMYLCPMWDYPYQQLIDSDSYSPRSKFAFASWDPEVSEAKVGLSMKYLGQPFETSFLQVLDESFDDEYDTNVPIFKGNCAMLILVMGGGTLDDIELTTGEMSVSSLFPGMGDAIQNAAQNISRERWKFAWKRMLEIGADQPADKIEGRFTRLMTAKDLFFKLNPGEQWSAIAVPQDPDTGLTFFDDVAKSGISWSDDILPIIESVEDLYYNPNYPDWSRASMRDFIPELVLIFDAIFDPVIDLLRMGSDMRGVIIALVDSLKDKIDRTQDIIDTIYNILDNIQRILDATGFHALYVSSNVGTEDLRKKILAAKGVPFNGNGFYSGITLLVGTANFEAFNNLIAPIGA